MVFIMASIIKEAEEPIGTPVSIGWAQLRQRRVNVAEQLFTLHVVREKLPRSVTFTGLDL